MNRPGSICVGITVGPNVSDSFSVLWSSGIHQNVVFLALLLQRLPEVDQCVLVSAEKDRPHALGRQFGLRTMDLDFAIKELDVIIELGQRFDAVSMGRFRDRGGRLVSYMAGNTLLMNFEAVASNVDHGEHMSEVIFDAVWITPQHWKTNQSYARLTRSPNVEKAPHIWHPHCLIEAIAQQSAGQFFWKDNSIRDGWRMAIFDPNVNVLKTFHLPLLVCEEGYRRRPDLIGRVLMFSADHLSENVHFREFCSAMDLGRDGRIFAEARHALAQVLGRHVDGVVTHQWENELNYLYWDVLYSGRPLIHNSEPAKDVGYYYEAFDPQDGGRVLIDALIEHPSRARALRSRTLEFLWQFDIDNPAVQGRYRELLESVMDQAA